MRGRAGEFGFNTALTLSVKDDKPRVAAQFERQLLDRACALLHQQIADLGRAGEGQLAWGSRLCAKKRPVRFGWLRSQTVLRGNAA
jgi:hypothetical protein